MKFIKATSVDQIPSFKRTLGIGLTPELVCTMGNLVASSTSVSEQALRWQPTGNVWPEVLVTCRSDSDTITAMAVYHNRYESWGVDAPIIYELSELTREPSRKKSPVVEAIALKATDETIPLEERVLWVAEILTGADKRAEFGPLLLRKSGITPDCGYCGQVGGVGQFDSICLDHGPATGWCKDGKYIPA